MAVATVNAGTFIVQRPYGLLAAICRQRERRRQLPGIRTTNHHSAARAVERRRIVHSVLSSVALCDASFCYCPFCQAFDTPNVRMPNVIAGPVTHLHKPTIASEAMDRAVRKIKFVLAARKTAQT